MAVLLLPVPDKVALPMVVVPSLKVTVPVGVKPVVVAVKVTLWPITAVVALVVKVVVVLALVTVTTLAVEVLAASLASPA